MTITVIPPLDEQITAILMRSGLFQAKPAVAEMTAEILRAIEAERDRPCLDPGCIAHRPHSRLGPHLWRHEAEPPFSHPFPFIWTCFTCGRLQGHRIHRVREEGW